MSGGVIPIRFAALLFDFDGVLIESEYIGNKHIADFLTSIGHGPTGREREALKLAGEGPTLLVTDLCTMTPNPATHEFEVLTLHPGVTRAQVQAATGWPVRFADSVGETPAPAEHELTALRDLHARTAVAHGTPLAVE